jgi:hypothetical protein
MRRAAKLKELQALFLTEAAKYQVLPIDDRSVERMDASVAGRPDLMRGRTSLTLYAGAVAMAENAFYAYNWLGREIYTIRGTAPLPVGPVTIRLDFAYDGGGRGKGGTATLTVNGREVASGRVANTIPNVFSTDEGVTVGVDDETAVTTDYPERNNRFTGRLGKVVIDVR